MGEAQEIGEHTLKRSLGPTNLVMLGIGAIIGARFRAERNPCGVD